MIYVISDLHGSDHKKFMKILEGASFDENDTLYVLGDVIDRNGDGGIETLQWIMDQDNVHLILGNHEAMLLACEVMVMNITDRTYKRLCDETQIQIMSTYLKNGGGITLKTISKLPKAAKEKIFDYLRTLPLYAEVSAGGKDYLLVHSGLGHFSYDKTPDRYSADELIWTRPRIDERYYSNVTTVFGHTPTAFYGKKYQGDILFTDTWIDIDVGAAGQEDAVMLRLDDMAQFDYLGPLDF